MLVCPSEDQPQTSAGDSGPRSYIFNGFNDAAIWPSMASTDWHETDPTKGANFAMRRVLMPLPSKVILLGEKEHGYDGWYTDIYAAAADDIYRIEESRHGPNRSDVESSGYSNYAFGDTSVRTLRWGESYNPVIQWAVKEEVRNSGTPPTPGT